SIGATWAMQIEAMDTQHITAQIFADSVALSGGAIAIGAAGAGARTDNRIKTQVKAYIDGTDPGSDSLGAMGIKAGSISVKATDDSTINANTGSTAISAVISLGGGGISLAVALAKNEIANEVEAYVLNGGTVEATGASGTEILATDSAHITSATVAASYNVSLGLLGSVSISGAGADAINVIHTKTLAHVDSSDLIRAGKIDVKATDSSTIDANVRTTSVAASGGTYSGALAIGAATSENYIGWGTDPTVASTYTTASNPSSILPNQTVKIATGADAGSVYKYIGSSPFTPPSSADTSWLALVDSSDKTKWQLVNLPKTGNASQVHAYLTSASAKPTGTLTVAAVEGAMITADIATGVTSGAIGGIAVAAAG